MVVDRALLTIDGVIAAARARRRGLVDGARVVGGVSTDTRSLRPGELFVALEGERFDGHCFVAEALKKGAVAALVRHDRLSGLSGAVPLLAVEEPLRALGRIARRYRRYFDIPVVGVTGSAGKTTAKEMIATVLACRHAVHKTPANENNEIGVPRALLGLKESHTAAVFELAARQVGDIRYLVDIVQPTIGVLLNIGTAHLEEFKSVERVAKAKGELLDYIRDESCVAFVNIDDCVIAREAKRTKGRLLGFGLRCESHFSGEGLVLDREGCGHFSLQHIPVHLRIPGRHNVHHALAAIAVGVECGISVEEAAAALAEFEPLRMRSESLRNRGIRVINDCYNANPESMRAALDLLGDMQVEGRRIAILGDMLELGDQAAALHRAVGGHGARRLDMLLGYGMLGRHIVVAARQAGMSAVAARHFDCQDDLLDHARRVVERGDTILVKASRGVGLEVIVDGLLSDTNQM